MLIDIYTKVKIAGELDESIDVVPRDLKCCGKEPNVRLLYSADASILEGKHILVETITPFDTLRGKPSGFIILPLWYSQSIFIPNNIPKSVSRDSIGGKKNACNVLICNRKERMADKLCVLFVYSCCR